MPRLPYVPSHTHDVFIGEDGVASPVRLNYTFTDENFRHQIRKILWDHYAPQHCRLIFDMLKIVCPERLLEHKLLKPPAQPKDNAQLV